MQPRAQRTIASPAEVSGIGFFTGADVLLRFRPAPAGHGIAFRRIDRPHTPPIPATISFAVPRRRRTAIARGEVAVEMIEHVMAALAGLQVDNCLVEVDAPETPGCDGSALPFVETLQRSGFVEQNAPREVQRIGAPLECDGEGAVIRAEPSAAATLTIAYMLDYGPDSPIPPQQFSVEVTPETFLGELAFSRTFVLESEVAALRAQGYGARTTARDLLVFGPEGVVDNALRAPDECVRHKILDCVGDLALLGCDLRGRIVAERSGHRLNRALVARLIAARGADRCCTSRAA